MAVHKGSEGTVKVGSDQVLELKDWSLSETAETIDVTTMGETARGFLPSLTSASGSFTAFWDETDTGQSALTVGAVVALNIYPEGDTAADTYATMSAIITEVGKSATFDGMVEASFSFQVDGAVTWGTV